LFLGAGPGGTGSYSLGGSGSLSVDNERIGNLGSGTFTQSGGTHTASLMVMANGTDASATYDLTDGSLSAVDEGVGRVGTGAFTQSAAPTG